MEDSRRYGIMKLNDDNYHVWQQRTELWLRKEDIWDVIEGTRPTTPDSGWEKRDRQARATIGLLIEDKFLCDIKHETTAKSTWKKLQQIHSHNTLGSRLILYRKIFSARYTAGTNIINHITGILEAASKLEDAGYKLLDELVCSALLGSLPQEYDVLLTTIEGRKASDITIDYVREKIIEEHRKKEGHHNTNSHDNRALLTNTRPTYNRRKNDMKCFYCHKVGHIRKDCRLLKKHNMHSEFTRQSNTNSQDQSRMMSYAPRNENHTNQDTKQEYRCDTSTYRALTTGLNYPDKNSYHWVIDTGAADHMCSNINNLYNISEVTSNITVATASGERHRVMNKGDYDLHLTDTQGNHNKITLTKVLHVPSLTEDLISIARLDDEGFNISFNQRESWLIHQDKRMLLGRLHHNLYLHVPQQKVGVNKTNLCGHVWHARLGHHNKHDIERMIKDNMVDGMTVSKCDNNGICKPCTLSKMTNKPFPVNNHKHATLPFQVIYSDLCGPISPESMGHSSYILTLNDEFSKFSHTYMLRHKNQTTEKVIDYVEKGITKFGRRPEIFFSDGGGEFINNQLQNYFSTRGIRHLNSLPYTPQKNGQAERYNRTLLETTCTLLKQSKLPDYMWAEMTNTATYLLNLVVHSNLKCSPYELWHGQCPKVSHLRTIGMDCYFLNPQPNKGKLDDRGTKGTLIGYGESTTFYRIWDSTSGKIYQSRKVIFPEESCPYVFLELPRENESETAEECPTKPEEIVETSPCDATPRRSSRHNIGRAPMILTYDHPGDSTPAQQDWFTRNFSQEDQPINRNEH